jgi:hypothetical protein
LRDPVVIPADVVAAARVGPEQLAHLAALLASRQYDHGARVGARQAAYGPTMLAPDGAPDGTMWADLRRRNRWTLAETLTAWRGDALRSAVHRAQWVHVDGA